MADLLGVTNPVPGYDGAGLNRGLEITPNDPHIQNIPDPGRVGRPDGRGEQQDAGDAAQSNVLRYDSNFQTFLQRLREAPNGLEILSHLLTGKQATVVSSGVGEGLATQMSQFMQMLPMDEGQLLQFLTSQMKEGARFGGAVFSLLRNAYRNARSETLREDILQFVKKYSDYSSTRHIAGNLLRNVRGMAQSMPASWSGKLTELAAQLENSLKAGDRAGSLQMLQNQVVPHVAEYVGRTHDMGKARALLSLLTLDMARYENGSEQGLIQAFRQLGGYPALKNTLGKIDDQALLKLLDNTQFAKAAQGGGFAETLASAAREGLSGAGGTETQETFQKLLTAVLINESVYMPLNHLMIPLEWEGKYMFSELWVDPDAEEPGKPGQEGGSGVQRFLFKMDIQGLGFFEMVLVCQKDQVSLRVNCPERVVPFSKMISGDLAQILTRNGLKSERVEVMKMERPLAISEVFPQIFEGKGGVNVKV